MNELAIYFIIFVLGVAAGIWAANRFYRMMIAIVLKDMGIDSQEKLGRFIDGMKEDLKAKDPEAYARLMERDTSDAIRVKLEQHQGILFAYRESDNQFLGQGNTKEDLIKSIGYRMKGCTIEIINAEMLKDQA